ncbi:MULTISPECIES: ANTAR domain-containing protein [Streptomyces]|uniref:ANTAR domain-containing protein n=1 Tax=Streptomyces TaxID=1883 RepID=UPI0002ABF7FF|nr:ANTAR domain-containing protein [Streptomyces sp. SID5471]
MPVPPLTSAGRDGPNGSSREARVSAALIDLADTLVADFDAAAFLYRVTEHCTALLDIDDAGLMLAAAPGSLRLIAATSEAARTVELFELDASEGPCHTAFHTSTTVEHTFSATATPRWPRFSTHAHRAGYTSIHATPVLRRSNTLGVLNLFRRAPGRLPIEDRDTARALADITAISLLLQSTLEEHRTVQDQLQHALNNRNIIEQAKGFLTARHPTDPDTAFHRIRTHARHHHLRLTDLSRDIVNGTVTLPPHPTTWRPREGVLAATPTPAQQGPAPGGSCDEAPVPRQIPDGCAYRATAQSRRTGRRVASVTVGCRPPAGGQAARYPSSRLRTGVRNTGSKQTAPDRAS